MKTPLSFAGRGLLSLLAVTTAAATVCYAQTPPVLTLQTAPGTVLLQITGDAGSPCAIQFATTPGPVVNWNLLTNLTMPASSVTIADAISATDAPRFYRVSINIPTNMIWVKSGSFLMGSPTNEALRNANELQHPVTLTNGFFIGKYAVRQVDYLSLMNTNPSYFAPNNGYSADPNRPVEQVSWFDASNYCARLTAQETTLGHIFTNWVYRLPTESEWEFACRAGTTNAFYFGTNLLSGMVNFDGEYEYLSGIGRVYDSSGVLLDLTSAVGSYQPNALGLYDMAGNIWEWCQDWFGNYPTNNVTNPSGPVNGAKRIFRGGGLNSPGDQCRSACRNSANPGTAVNTIGFRVVLAPGP